MDKLTDHAHSSSGQESKQDPSGLASGAVSRKAPNTNSRNLPQEENPVPSTSALLAKTRLLNSGAVRIITAPATNENGTIGESSDKIKHSSMVLEEDTSKDRKSQPSAPFDHKFKKENRDDKLAIIENPRVSSEINSPKESSK
mmetsp:Transcript_17487/g.26957  ORF Transcript_17487/g.26957 Transcript_17487/m.26957 type:complete len:143 (+) Transcript_17487:672-1100(+)